MSKKIIDINIKANLVYQFKTYYNENTAVGYIAGCIACAFNGHKDRYDAVHELLIKISEQVLPIFDKDFDADSAEIKIETSGFKGVILWASGLNDIDIRVERKERNDN